MNILSGLGEISLLQYLDYKIQDFLYEKPVYKKLSTRTSEKQTFETTKKTFYFTILGILILLFAVFEIPNQFLQKFLYVPYGKCYAGALLSILIFSKYFL